MTDSDRVMVVFLIGLLVGFALGAVVVAHHYRNAASDRGYAAYCLNNLEWAWRGECGE